jgi:uncharacterized membrane protein
MYDILLMIHFLSLGAGLGISLTMFVLGLQAGKIPPQEFGPMMGRIGLAMKNVAIGGVTLLVLSGVSLAFVEPDMVTAGGGWFHAKLVFVAGVVIAFAIVQINQARARRGENRSCRSTRPARAAAKTRRLPAAAPCWPVAWPWPAPWPRQSWR